MASPIPVMPPTAPSAAFTTAPAVPIEPLNLAQVLKQGPDIIREAYRASGLPWPTSADAVSYDELMEEAYAERYGSGLGWNSAADSSEASYRQLKSN